MHISSVLWDILTVSAWNVVILSSTEVARIREKFRSKAYTVEPNKSKMREGEPPIFPSYLYLWLERIKKIWIRQATLTKFLCLQIFPSCSILIALSGPTTRPRSPQPHSSSKEFFNLLEADPSVIHHGGHGQPHQLHPRHAPLHPPCPLRVHRHRVPEGGRGQQQLRRYATGYRGSPCSGEELLITSWCARVAGLSLC